MRKACIAERKKDLARESPPIFHRKKQALADSIHFFHEKNGGLVG